VSYCEGVTDATLSALSAATRLRDFSAEGCVLVHDFAVGELLAAHQHMSLVNLSLCPAISDETARLMRTFGANLALVKLLGCRGLTEFGLSLIQEALPTCVVVCALDTLARRRKTATFRPVCETKDFEWRRNVLDALDEGGGV
jgi:hypothetical protein